MPENLKVGYSMPGQKNRRPHKKYLSLAQAKQVIEKRNYGEYITHELMKKISKYPQNTYEKFLHKINTHIDAIQKKKLAETGSFVEKPESKSFAPDSFEE